MKTNQSSSRKSAVIPNSRWLAYATAGAASAFATTHSAEATIHYSGPINRIFSLNEKATFQLDQPGDSFRLIHYSGTDYFGYNFFGVDGRAAASVAGFYNCCCRGSRVNASNLERGQLISRRPFEPGQSALLAAVGCGQFIRRGIGYIGFKFNNGSGDQYGWVRIEMKQTFYNNFILRDYAYGDVGDRVKAGQISDNDSPALESLGGLALGAAGLLAWRKRRSQTAQAK